MFGSSTAAVRDLVFRVNLGQMRTELPEALGLYNRVTGGMSESAVRLNVKQVELSRAVEKFGINSTQAAKRALALKAEMDGLTVASERHSSALLAEERALGRFTRGALAAGGASSELKRALLLGSGSFLLGVGLISGLKKAVDAAKEQQVAQGQLQVSLKNSRLEWSQYGDEIERVLGVQVKTTAFNKDELTTVLAANVRRFGDVNEALKANAIEADVARARNISLADAQVLVQRASFGNTRALKTLGIDMTASTSNLDRLREVTKHTTAEQVAQAKASDLQANRTTALGLIESKYHGNAARYLQTSAGKQALFNAELKSSEEIIGQALLPTINHYLDKLSTWLDKMNRSGQLQRDVNKAMHDASEIVHGVGDAFHALAVPLGLVNKLLGGTRHSVELLTLAFIAMKLGVLPSLFNAVAGSIRGVGAAAATTAGEVNTLAAAERTAATTTPGGVILPPGVTTPGTPGGGGAFGLGSGGPISPLGALGISLLGSVPDSQEQPALKVIGGKHDGETDHIIDPEHKLRAGQTAVYKGESYKVGIKDGKLVLVSMGLVYKDRYRITDSYVPPPEGNGGTGGGGGSTGYKPTGVQALDLAIAQAQASGNTAQIRAAAAAKLAYDVKAAAFAQGRIAAGKGSTSLVQQYEQVLADEASQRSAIQSIDDAAASASKSAADKAAAAEKKRKAAQAAALRKHQEALAKEKREAAAKLAAQLTHSESVLKLAVEKAKLTDPVADDIKAAEALEAFYKQKANDPRLNRKLRDAFAAKDIAERIVLKKLKAAQGSASRSALAQDEQAFLSEFAGVIQNFAPNAIPNGGKSETHLFEAVHELRGIKKHLATVVAKGKFPASKFADEQAAAVTG